MANFNINGKLLDSLIAKGCDMMGWDMWALDVDAQLCAASYYVDNIIDSLPDGECQTTSMWERKGRQIEALRKEWRRRKEARVARLAEDDANEI